MPLNDSELKTWAQSGGVTPFDDKLVNPASLDLRTAGELRKPRWYWRYGLTRFLAWEILKRFAPHKLEHSAANVNVYWTERVHFDSYTLYPGQMILLNSFEYVKIRPDQSGMILAKSSSGRKGLEHLHSGWIDPGFNGQITFEVENVAGWPVEIRAGERLMQLIVLDTNEPENTYNGRYQNQLGPQSALETNENS